MTDLVDTTEMYLRTIIDLEEEGIPPFRARISERLGHSGPTVSQTIARMERDGLVVVEADRQLSLTKPGRKKAIEVTRKHRLAERLLADVIGLDWSLVHDEACRWEHVMSEQVERKIIAMLGSPTESPYGNPIPAMEALGGPKAEGFLVGVTRVTEFASEQTRSAVLRRLGEPAQFDSDLLARFSSAGVIPGASVSVTRMGDDYEISAAGGQGSVQVSSDIADHLYVAA
ncbi:MAG: dihydrofolate reductase [Microbacteriaceae bacterium BACL25 MAG-120322-bin65]|nr:MAG: dihydrofolate reductase [Microbacteriaceae bacterium BACL25 MAG-120322-bin65]